MKGIVEQMKMFEEFVNGVPGVINPCKLCKNRGDIYYGECCVSCCYFYASNFEADKTKVWTQKE